MLHFTNSFVKSLFVLYISPFCFTDPHQVMNVSISITFEGMH